MPQWQEQDTFVPGAPIEESYDNYHGRGERENLDTDTTESVQRSSSSTGGSLFQRMRNVFEQPTLNAPQQPASFSGGAKSTSRTKNSSPFGAYNEEDDDSDEHSSLLNHGAGTRMSAN
jgi:hypothetical protein